MQTRLLNGLLKIAQRAQKHIIVIIVNRHRDIRINNLHELHAHLRIHCYHQQGDFRTRDRGSAQVDEHQVYGLAGVRAVHLGDLVEVVEEEGVATDIDSVAGLESACAVV